MALRSAAPLLVIMLAVSGCAGPEPAASPTAPPPATSTPTPTPTPEPTLPAVDELALAPGSLNLLVLGEPAPAADDPAAMIVFELDRCVEERGLEPGDPGTGLWVAAPPYRSAEGRTFFQVGVNDAGLVTALQVVGDSPVRTTEGIGIGSSVSDLLAAYPSASAPIDAILTRLYTVTDGEHQLIFETSWAEGAGDGYWPEDEVDEVVIMTAQSASAPFGALWATDGGVGGCF